MEQAIRPRIQPRFTRLARSEELSLLEKTRSRDHGNRDLRRRLAFAYFERDRFDDAIPLLEALGEAGDDAEACKMLAECFLARETAAGNRVARDYAQRAAVAAPDARWRASALAALGKAQLRLGDADQARTSFAEALRLNPGQRDAFKRQATLCLQQGRPEEALRLADAAIGADQGHARALAARALALARLDRVAEARESFGLDRFLRIAELPVPTGWASLEAFNRDVAAELLQHPSYHYGRYGAASTRSWRVDDPGVSRFVALTALHRALAAMIEQYLDALPAGSHPWQRAMRPEVHFHGWAVISEGEGYEEWHVHQNGWLSGAYYVEVPEEIATGQDRSGCIAFGLPEEFVGEDRQAQFGMEILRPRSGLLAMFPSHCYHRTFTYRGGRRRICFAFDVAALPTAEPVAAG